MTSHLKLIPMSEKMIRKLRRQNDFYFAPPCLHHRTLDSMWAILCSIPDSRTWNLIALILRLNSLFQRLKSQSLGKTLGFGEKYMLLFSRVFVARMLHCCISGCDRNGKALQHGVILMQHSQAYFSHLIFQQLKKH